MPHEAARELCHAVQAVEGDRSDQPSVVQPLRVVASERAKVADDIPRAEHAGQEEAQPPL